MEQQFLRLGRVRIQPTLYGGKGFGRTVLINSYLEDFDNGCLFLFRGVLEDLYLFIERDANRFATQRVLGTRQVIDTDSPKTHACFLIMPNSSL